MENIPVISFVAFSNTGKTTFLEKLIPLLKAEGLRIAVLKHDAHEFQVDKEGKDSWRMSRAGADVTIITSSTHAAIMENRPVPAEELLRRVTGVDLIITEGYKEGPWPKIAMARSANGKPLPVPAESCAAVVTDIPGDYPCPAFGLEDAAGVCRLIAGSLQKWGGAQVN